MPAAVRAMGIEVATVTSPVGRVFSGAGLEQAAARRTRTAVIAPRPTRPTGLLLFFFLRVLVAGIDDQGLFDGLRLIARLAARALGRLFLGLVRVLVAFFVRVPPEAGEVALDVRPFLRLGRAVVARAGDPARVLDALQDLTNGNARVLLVVTDDRRHVLVASSDQIDEAPADLRLEEAEQLPVARVERQQALLLLELALRPGAVTGQDVRRRRVDQAEDAGLPHVLDEEPGLRPGSRDVRLGVVLEQLRDSLRATDGDGVVRLGLQHLGERRLGLLQLALLEECAAHAVARLDVVGGGFEDLRVEVGRARPVRLEGGRDGLIREGSNAQSSVRGGCHGSPHSSPTSPGGTLARVPYLSDIQHRRVIEPNGTEVAKLADLAVVPQGQFPAVQWAILATPEGERIVRWSELAQEIGHLRLRGRLSTIADAQLPQEALRLSRDLMDKQVVDTHGAKVVRVNDLQLSEVDGQLRLVGADVGLRGLLRRVGAETVAERVAGLAGRRLPRGIIPWHLVEPLEAAHDAPAKTAAVRLTIPHAKLALLHPADIADIVEEMTADERIAVFQQLDLETAAEALQEVEPEMQAAIVSDLPEERAADILEERDPDEAADLLQDPSEERRDEPVALMDKEEAKDVEELLTYPEDSAGGIMRSDFFALPGGLPAAPAGGQRPPRQPDPAP